MDAGQKPLKWLLAVVFVLIGVWSLAPPRPQPADAPLTEFSAERAFEHIRVIAAEPHPMGSDEIADVRDYLGSELERLGVDVEFQTATAPASYGRTGTVPITNVIGRIPGTGGQASIVLVAHYDTFPATAGANDNTAAVAALLETARAVTAGPPVANDLVFLFTDAEEPWPRFGSPEFVDAHGRDVDLVANFEAGGGSGPSMLAETNGPDGWLVGELAAATPDLVAFSFMPALTNAIGEIGTDFDVFRRIGVPGFHFAYLRGGPIYHTPADDPDSVSLASLQHHGEYALAISRHFGDLDLAPTGGDTAYASVGPWFLQHDVVWAQAAAIVAAALLGWTTWRARRAGIRRRTLRSTLVAIGGTLAGTIVATVMWTGLASVRTAPAVWESYLYLAALTALAAGVAALTMRRFGTGEPGFAVVWVTLGLVTAFALPGAGYLFVWPALAAVVADAWRTWSAQPERLADFVLVAAPALILATPAVEFFWLFGQPRPGNPDSNIPAVAGLAIFVAVLVFGLVASRNPAAVPEPALDEAAPNVVPAGRS